MSKSLLVRINGKSPHAPRALVITRDRHDKHMKVWIEGGRLFEDIS